MHTDKNGHVCVSVCLCVCVCVSVFPIKQQDEKPGHTISSGDES